MHVSQKVLTKDEGRKSATVSFSKRDVRGVLASDNDPMVIKVYIQEWSVKRVLIDTGSSADVLYWTAFKGMGMDAYEMLLFKGMLVSFASK